jgi:hypothetical protein
VVVNRVFFLKLKNHDFSKFAYLFHGYVYFVTFKNCSVVNDFVKRDGYWNAKYLIGEINSIRFAKL